MAVPPSDRRPASALDDRARLQVLVRQNFSYVWRSLRRVGLDGADADDAAQQVFIVLARKLPELQRGNERAFLYGTAMRIAWRARRTLKRRREDLHEALDHANCPIPAPDQLLVQRDARLLLDEILCSLPLDVRNVFTLFELEGMSLNEIAAALSIPRGTVASRLRRGREDFQRRVERHERSGSRYRIAP
jgi:RNA polymerase sigma-70 factor (ECF subfamily)